jgi:GWxTD domain-containing protein
MPRFARPLPSVVRTSSLFVAGLLAGLLAAAPAGAAWLRPQETGGNFYGVVDLANLYGPDGRLDVVVEIAIENRELSLEPEGGRFRGTVEAYASLVSPEGQTVEAQATVPVMARTEADATSPALQQIFTLVLPDVGFRSGQFTLELRDAKRKRPVLFSLFTKEKAVSQVVTDWAAPAAAADSLGLAVGDLVFLTHAPLQDWIAAGSRGSAPGKGGPWDYLHPQRRYGLGETRVQVYFSVSPPAAAAARARAAGSDLLVEVLSKDLDFALRDTLTLTPQVRSALAAGRDAAVYYELDASLLPPGSFRLGIVPLADAGRGYLGEFDISWRLDQLAHGRDIMSGEGHIVFSGADLDRYVAATRVEQEVMLEEFWRQLDPDPSDPYNEVYTEFRRRVNYAKANLGGFSSQGPRDDRGLIYILLGPADRVSREAMPMNENDLADARIQVYQPYAPDREGSWAKGADPAGSQTISPYFNKGGITMPYSSAADQEIKETRTSSTRDHGFELWRYDRGGTSLFPHQYTNAVPLNGLQFLFVDIDGTGRYRLESSNATRSGD